MVHGKRRKADQENGFVLPMYGVCHVVKVVVHVLGALGGIMKFCGDMGGMGMGHWHKVIQLVRALKCPLPQRHKCKTEGIGLFL